MKNVLVLMVILILSVSGKSQTSCIYINGIGGYSTQGQTMGVSVGYNRGYLIEFSGYANPNTITGGRNDTKSPFLLMVKGGYAFKLTESWSVGVLAGACGYFIEKIDYDDPHQDRIPYSKILPIVSPRIMYTLPEDNIRCFKAYVGVNYMKYSPAVEIGFTIDFDLN